MAEQTIYKRTGNKRGHNKGLLATALFSCTSDARSGTRTLRRSALAPSAEPRRPDMGIFRAMVGIGWHGWGRGHQPYRNRVLHIGPLPGRKSIALYTRDFRDGAVMYVHAYFRSTEEAQRALETLDWLMEPGWDSDAAGRVSG